jgi:hypothetical protein
MFLDSSHAIHCQVFVTISVKVARHSVFRVTGSASSSGEDSRNGGNLSDVISADPSPAISMVSKHSNGTLNLWQLTFADHTKFSQVLSIGHSSRASGHRFRVNDITCHPVLPLLLTTSHHNITDFPSSPPSNITVEDSMNPLVKNKDVTAPTVSILLYWVSQRNILHFKLHIATETLEVHE